MGLSYRRKRNASLRATGEPVPMGWDAGVKRVARFLKNWPAMEIDPDRLPLYQNQNGRWREFLRKRAEWEIKS